MSKTLTGIHNDKLQAITMKTLTPDSVNLALKNES